jgi:D-glycero-D-manno-heptose 1,7-bisphosphate phosphatase
VKGRPAVFLDRDGTIIREYGNFWEPSQIELIGGAADAIRRLKAAGYMAIVTTNQSGIAQGVFDEHQFWIGEQKMEELLAAQGIKLDAVYFCPHHPTKGDTPYRADCECRKPKPGMIMRAAREYGIDLPSSYMIGDSDDDVGAGNAAGVRTIKVDTGYGRGVSPIGRHDIIDPATGKPPRPTAQAPNLAEASHWILRQAR